MRASSASKPAIDDLGGHRAISRQTDDSQLASRDRTVRCGATPAEPGVAAIATTRPDGSVTWSHGAGAGPQTVADPQTAGAVAAKTPHNAAQLQQMMEAVVSDEPAERPDRGRRAAEDPPAQSDPSASRSRVHLLRTVYDPKVPCGVIEIRRAAPTSSVCGCPHRSREGHGGQDEWTIWHRTKSRPARDARQCRGLRKAAMTGNPRLLAAARSRRHARAGGIA